ncbi:hypothetical protein POM88_010866 [Heracleum sosnowskyi]|uniref:Retrovirus-related Pol polyprotein from transposon TNT 1-94-like beta-barrel domain-containing protein n=1 Tax=Heracleum sosnowskyi TaxID=360622 RepID=A0AAD8IXD1_9APIA|nr:hypothetical protein POM88_010866 [Heracleum sosnowskyi]
MKDSEQLDDFCLKLNGLVANIRALGETIGDEYVVKKLLRAVSTKFLQIASTIEQFGNLEKMSVEEVIGSLKAHEERLSSQGDNKEGQQLLLTEEEWSKREHEDSNRKLLLTREEWLSRKSNRGASQAGNDYRGRDTQAECRKPRKNRLQQGEVNLAQTNDDEPALLMTMCEESADEVVFLSEGADSNTRATEESIWYLDNGASNHMTGRREKFEKLDKSMNRLSLVMVLS